jgi:L-threonylcarbamoyladenylate synthase
MRILPINDPSAIPEAVSALRQGLLIVFPTDTAYALGADIFNVQALEAVQRLKGRSAPKPLALIASDLAQVEQFTEVTPSERLLAERYWPGPLTILFQPREAITKQVTIGQSRVGIRVPNSTVARTIAAKLGRPVVATSANLTGEVAPYSTAVIVQAFQGRSDAPVVLLDAGELSVVPPSTIVELLDEKVIVRRPGPITVE